MPLKLSSRFQRNTFLPGRSPILTPSRRRPWRILPHSFAKSFAITVDKATFDQIAAALAPQIFDSATFKKWWDFARKSLKADGHFQLPARKSEPVVLLATPSTPGQGLIEKFRGARHLKDQVAALDQITKALDDLAHEVEELQSLAVQIEDAAHKGRKLQSAQAVELLLARDEILARHQALKPGKDAPGVADILRGEQSRLPELFAALPAAKQRRCIEQFPEAFGDRWLEAILRLTQNVPARLVIEIVRLVEKEGRSEDLRAALARWISERSASSEILCVALQGTGRLRFRSFSALTSSARC